MDIDVQVNDKVTRLLGDSRMDLKSRLKPDPEMALLIPDSGFLAFLNDYVILPKESF